MSSEELITKQAEMVFAADPGVEGYNPRVWAYRNTIKALNWYSSVREKLDDPKYSSWFIKFKGFQTGTTYPGGTQKDSTGKATNGTFHVPTCDWFGTADKPAKCSGFCKYTRNPQSLHVLDLSFTRHFLYLDLL
jgi:hypothetical protein